MRRRVIAVEHRDRDPEEFADTWHVVTLPRLRRWTVTETAHHGALKRCLCGMSNHVELAGGVAGLAGYRTFAFSCKRMK